MDIWNSLSDRNFIDKPVANKELKEISQTDLKSLFDTLSKLIYQLNKNGILTVQRTCYACKFYKRKENKDHCNLLNKELLNTDIRLDCPEFVENK